MSSLDPSLDSLLAGTHIEPHAVLGPCPSPTGVGVLVRFRHPTAAAASIVVGGGIVAMKRTADGLFEAPLPAWPERGYRIELQWADGRRTSVGDPYRFSPTLGELDLHLISEGRHERLWEVLGSHKIVHEGVVGVRFALWAPNARAVRVVGDWNDWDGRVHPMRSLGASGVWELFVPLVEPGVHYKYELIDSEGRLALRADPMAREAERPPATASIVTTSNHLWEDEAWMAVRAAASFDGRLSIYEVHPESWRRVPEDGDRPLTYRELADQLADHVIDLGFTHVELMAIAEHPFSGSWGYQVTGYYAPTSRLGTPDDFRLLVDSLHRRGIGVIVDWVPAHFPKDAFALGRFDGTALYEHSDARQGEHPDWGTYVFNYARNEVRNFLVANALYWFDEFHVDGLRVDAVASMLYLDYSRASGEWVPNEVGGRENHAAIAFIKELNSVVHRHHDGVMVIAEESTAWSGVTSPVDVGGLGFTHKWNMGWMHDTLEYFEKDPIYRSHEHHKLTFGLLYAFSENFVLPLSHDEVVHGKGSLLNKMPGDRWQQFANLRALYAWMWAHPGKQVLFMGGEFAQDREWSHERSLDWHLVEEAAHGGVKDLIRSLNEVQARHPALYARDFSSDGFCWLDDASRATSIYTIARSGGPSEAGPVLCCANLTPVPRYGYRIGLPHSGAWREVLNTDDLRWGGSGMTNPNVVAEAIAWQGLHSSAVITLPPLGVVYLAAD